MKGGERLRLALVLVAATILRQPFLLGVEHARYWFDEKFILENATRVAVEGDLRPRWVYYPALAHYPHAAGIALGRAASAGVEALGAGPGFDLVGARPGHRMWIARRVQGLLGILTVWVTWAVARRLYGPRTALWAALVLSAAPAHLRISMELKPQAGLVLFVLLATWAALRVRERPTFGRTALAGFFIGSAVSCNYNAATAAVPLGLCVATAGTGRLGGLLRLGLAAAVSFATFVLWNPYFALAPGWYLGTLRGFALAYRHKENLRGLGAGRLTATIAEYVPSYFLGWPAGLACFAAVGLAALAAVRARRAGRPPAGGFAHLLVLGFVLVHAGLTIAMTRLLALQHYAPIVPFLAIAAGWAAATALEGIAAGPAGRWGAWAAAAAAALSLAVAPWRLYRESGIQTTAEAALEAVRQSANPAGRILSLGIEAPPAYRLLPLDRAGRVPAGLLERAHWLLAPLDAVAAAGRSPAASLWLAPDLVLVARLSAEPPRRIGRDVVLLEVPRSALGSAEQREVALAGFTVTGTGGVDGVVVWVRDAGSVARARSPLEAAPGERIEVEVQAAGDDSGLVAGGRLVLAIGAGGIHTRREVRPNDPDVYRSAPLELPPGPFAIELVYAGDRGGRVYATRVAVRRIVARADLAPELLARRSVELERAARAGL